MIDYKKLMNTLKNILYKFYHLAHYMYYYIFTNNTFRANVNKWFLIEWDKKYIINHNLTEESIVFEVGWYTWVFSDHIIDKYNCYMYIFEPVKDFYDILIEKYKDNPKIKIYQFWLSNQTKKQTISKSSDESSIFKKWFKEETIQIVDIYEFLKKNNLIYKKIDLIQINIEWGEYDLLPRIIERVPDIFQNIQVQFHDFVENANIKRNNILYSLSEHNYVSGYSFPFVREYFYKK